VNASFFLSRLLMTKVSEHGEDVYLAFIRQKVALEYVPNCSNFCAHAYSFHFTSKKYPYVFPSRPPVQITSKPLDSGYPLVLPAPSFKSDEIVGLRRVPITKTELLQYQQHPEQLQKETFVSFNSDDGEWEVFRVFAFLTLDRDKIFYLVFADDDAEAVAWSKDQFLQLLCTSNRVLT
jgi:hypothetical protein